MLTTTKTLLRDYAAKLTSGNITEGELKALASDKRFARSIEHDAHKPITNRNHSRQDVFLDFMAAIGPLIPQKELHDLACCTIALEVSAHKADPNVAMRNPCLGKYFLEFELVKYPKEGQKHFEQEPLKTMFKSEQNKNTILGHGMRYFQQPPELSPISEEEYGMLMASQANVLKAAEQAQRRGHITQALYDDINTYSTHLTEGNNSIAPFEALIQLVKHKEEKAKENPLSQLMHQFMQLVRKVFHIPEPKTTTEEMRSYLDAARPSVTGERFKPSGP